MRFMQSLLKGLYDSFVMQRSILLSIPAGTSQHVVPRVSRFSSCLKIRSHGGASLALPACQAEARNLVSLAKPGVCCRTFCIMLFSLLENEPKFGASA